MCLTQTEINKTHTIRELPSNNSSFEKLLVEAIDETFSSLGDSCKQAIYFKLEETYKISKPDIPCKIEDFTYAIEKIFNIGAKFLEIRIMESLFRKIGQFKYFPMQGTLNFTEYLAALRRIL